MISRMKMFSSLVSSPGHVSKNRLPIPMRSRFLRQMVILSRNSSFSLTMAFRAARDITGGFVALRGFVGEELKGACDGIVGGSVVAEAAACAADSLDGRNSGEVHAELSAGTGTGAFSLESKQKKNKNHPNKTSRSSRCGVDISGGLE